MYKVCFACNLCTVRSLCVDMLGNAIMAYPGECMWVRMKPELFYGRYDTKKITKAEHKVKKWRYFMSYWNNRRICSTNGGLPPMVKRRKYYFYHEEIV